MNMKEHILAAMKEQFDHWEELLGGLREEQISIPLSPSDWSIQDNIVHLWAWQLRSTARLEASLLNREPEFPRWPTTQNPDTASNVDQINAWIYETYHEQPWTSVHQNWRKGFQQLLESAEKISEKDLLDGDRYPWMEGYSLALVLIASYDHHQEHYEKLLAWMQEHGYTSITG